jgi:hypothetical protein
VIGRALRMRPPTRSITSIERKSMTSRQERDERVGLPAALETCSDVQGTAAGVEPFNSPELVFATARSVDEMAAS